MQKDEWLTPPWLLNRLGKFDLDPCASIAMPWPTAKTHYTIEDNGLLRPWFGRVWCNPPYGRYAAKWLYLMAKHGNGIALTFARTETDMFFRTVWGRCDGLLFLKGRLYFYDSNGIEAKNNSGAPSVLIAYGDNNAEILKRSNIDGAFVKQSL